MSRVKGSKERVLGSTARMQGSSRALMFCLLVWNMRGGVILKSYLVKSG